MSKWRIRMKLSQTEIFTGENALAQSNLRFVHKFSALICVVIVAISCGCSSKSIVGKWKSVQRYDSFHEKWEPAKDDVDIEFSAGGTYKALTLGKLTQGIYTTDKSRTPNRLVLTDEKSGTFSTVFIVDERTLTLKGFKDGRSEFPTTLDPDNNESVFELVRLERQN